MIFKYQNLNINYEIFDERKDKEDGSKPLLLLHGWMAQIESWAPIYLHYAQTRPVYVIDFPGQSGKSSKLKEAWGVPEYAEMVKAFIKFCKIKGTDVIGHSFGGRVIIYLSSKYQELFNKIILTDSAGIKPKFSFKRFTKIYSYKLAKFFYKIIMSKEKYEAKLDEMRKKRGSSDYSKLQSDVARQTFNKVINLDLTNELKNIENPVLLIWGENDKDTPLYMAKIIEKKVKDCGLVVIENAGHFSYLDNTAKYLLIADTFLQQS